MTTAVEDERSAQSVRETDSIPGPDKDGFTALHSAAQRGLCKTVEALLEKSAGLDARSSSGETPLLAACKAGRAKVADVLVKANANVLAQDGQGQSPLHWYAFLSFHAPPPLPSTKGSLQKHRRLCLVRAPSRVAIGRMDEFLTQSLFGSLRLLSSRSVQQSDTALSMLLLKTGSCPNLQVQLLPSKLMAPALRERQLSLLPLLPLPLQDMLPFYGTPKKP